jgi:hypothetical protein
MSEEQEIVVLPPSTVTARALGLDLEAEVIQGNAYETELEKQRRGSPEGRRATKEQAAQEKAERAKHAAYVVTMRDVKLQTEPAPPPSLKAAYDTVVYEGGRLELDGNGRLLIVVPGMTETLRLPCRLLYFCEDVVVDHLRRGADLPESELTGAGAVISEPKPKGKRA